MGIEVYLKEQEYLKDKNERDISVDNITIKNVLESLNDYVGHGIIEVLEAFATENNKGFIEELNRLSNNNKLLKT